MSTTLTILGCGPSGGVPRLGPDWGKCDPQNPKNRRRRCAVLVQKKTQAGETNVLIDTPPDLREQLIDVGVKLLDGVLFTHDHADHTHGIDDLRPICYEKGRLVDCYFDNDTGASLKQRFSYCFSRNRNSSYAPILRAHVLTDSESFRINGAGGRLTFLPIRQVHGDMTTLGFRVGNLAYSPDVSDLAEEAQADLEGLDVWIVDALRRTPHPCHFHLERTLEWAAILKPKMVVLTHMTTDLDYETLRKELPENVRPAFDGMVIEVPQL